MGIRIVQLTDCHLFEDRTRDLRGHTNWPRLAAVLADIATTVPDFDRLLITGDTAHDELTATYEMVCGELGALAEKVSIIPGNHDLRAGLRSVFPQDSGMPGERVTFRFTCGGWQIVGLDSLRPGEVAGSLGIEQLDWLRKVLSSTRDLPTMLALHHHPVPVPSTWLEGIGLLDAAQFAEVVRESPQVRLLVCGHIHQEFSASLGAVPIFATPAVGPQFRPRSEQLIVEKSPPAYRIIELQEGGAWSTQVTRLRNG